MSAPRINSTVGNIEPSSTQATPDNDPIGALTTRDAGCQTVPCQARGQGAADQAAIGETDQSVVENQDKELSELRLRRQNPGLLFSSLVPGASAMIYLNHNVDGEKKVPANMAEAAYPSISGIRGDVQHPGDKPVDTKEPTASRESSTVSGGASLVTQIFQPLVLTATLHIGDNRHSRDQSVVSEGQTPNKESSSGGTPLMTKIFSPLVLTATPHIPFNPASSTLTSIASKLAVFTGEDLSSDFLENYVYHFQSFMAPSIHRQDHDRVPPTSPPDVVKEDRLSMPTLPSFHNTSRPELIERYRLVYRCNPEAFEAKTKKIKSDLVRLKVARGGENFLFENEYTVELASRLDAVTAEAMGALRDHDNQIESEDVDDEGNDNNKDHDAEPHSYKDYARIDRARLSEAPISLEYDSELVSEHFEDGSERRTYVKNIQITQVVNVPAAKRGEPRVTHEHVENMEDNTVGEVAELLRRMAAQVGDL